MTTVQINRELVDAILAPWWGLADEDGSHQWYLDLGLDDESALRKLVQKEIAPSFSFWDLQDQELARDSMRYVICREPHTLERVFESYLPPFTPPSIERLFHIVWEELFQGYALAIRNNEEFMMLDNIHESNRVLGRAKCNIDEVLHNGKQ